MIVAIKKKSIFFGVCVAFDNNCMSQFYRFVFLSQDASLYRMQQLQVNGQNFPKYIYLKHLSHVNI